MSADLAKGKRSYQPLPLARSAQVKTHALEDCCILFYCLMYILAINWALKENYMNAEIIVSSYEKSFSLSRMILCLVSVVALKRYTFAMVNRTENVSFYIIRVLFFLYQIPLTLSFCLFDHRNFLEFILLEMIYWMFLCLALHFVSSVRFRKISKANFKIPRSLLRMAGIIVILIGLVLSLRAIGGITVSFSLSGIYRMRAAFKESASDIVTFFKSAVGGYLCPCIIAYYIARKKWILGAGACVVQAAFYLMARDKMYLFMLPIAIGVGLIGRFIKSHFDRFMSKAYLGYGAALFLAAVNIKRTLIMELLTRRIMVVPTYLNYIYFDYFTTNTPIWWRQDTFLVDKLFTPIYNQSVPLQISEVYFNKLEGNPNAGMFAEAISRNGYFGVIIYPILLALLFMIFDKLYKDTDGEVKIVLGVCLAIAVSNDVITSTSFVITTCMIFIGSCFFRNGKKKPVSAAETKGLQLGAGENT